MQGGGGGQVDDTWRIIFPGRALQETLSYEKGQLDKVRQFPTPPNGIRLSCENRTLELVRYIRGANVLLSCVRIPPNVASTKLSYGGKSQPYATSTCTG